MREVLANFLFFLKDVTTRNPSGVRKLVEPHTTRLEWPVEPW